MTSEGDVEMAITVKFIGVFRSISGKGRLTIKFKGAIPLKNAIEEIVEELPKLELVLIDPELKDPRPNTLILVNGKEINVLKGLETMVDDGDEVVFVPVVHGG
jgi:molybdopterin synthase sulfur carrier subunit